MFAYNFGRGQWVLLIIAIVNLAGTVSEFLLPHSNKLSKV